MGSAVEVVRCEVVAFRERVFRFAGDASSSCVDIDDAARDCEVRFTPDVGCEVPLRLPDGGRAEVDGCIAGAAWLPEETSGGKSDDGLRP